MLHEWASKQTADRFSFFSLRISYLALCDSEQLQRVACWKYWSPWLYLSDASHTWSTSSLFWLAKIDTDILPFLPSTCQQSTWMTRDSFFINNLNTCSFWRKRSQPTGEKNSATPSAATSLVVSLDSISCSISWRSLASHLGISVSLHCFTSLCGR